VLEAQALGHAAGQIVHLLAAGAGDDHDGGVAVLDEAVLVGGVHGGDLVHGGLAGIVHLGGGLVLVVDVGVTQLVVDVDHGGVEVEAGALKGELVALPLADGGGRGGAPGTHGPGDGVGEVGGVLAQGLLQADIGALGFYAEAGAQKVGVGADAQQGHVGAAGEGQRVVLVLQQDAALGHLPAAQVDGRLDEGVGVAGAVGVEDLGGGREFVVQGVFIGVVGDEHLTGGAQIGVDGSGVGLQDIAQDQGQGQGEAGQAGNAAP